MPSPTIIQSDIGLQVPPTQPVRQIVVIGASAGGVDAVLRLLEGLPRSLPAAVFVVIHIAPTNSSLFPSIIERRTGHPARHPADGEPIERGMVYVAPPDLHMTLEKTKVRISSGPKHNLHRPAIDPFFRSAAEQFRGQVIGVVLTGFLDDGAAGLAAIKQHGGVTIVQDPRDASAPSMPLSALQLQEPDYCVPLAQVPKLIDSLVRSARMPKKVKILESRRELTPFTCPDCHGTIWEVEDEGGLRFECRVGHSYSPETMMIANHESLERALWAALRSLEESASLSRRLAKNASRSKRDKAAKIYARKAAEREMHADQIRQILLAPEPRRKSNGGVDLQSKDAERQAS